MVTTLHMLAVVAGLICYTVLTALGHDGTAVLSAALGYGGGAIAERSGVAAVKARQAAKESA